MFMDLGGLPGEMRAASVYTSRNCSLGTAPTQQLPSFLKG